MMSKELFMADSVTNTIHYMKVELEPWVYATNHPTQVLRVKIRVNDKEYTHERVIPRDDVSSLLDVIFREALEILKTEIRGEKS